MMDLLQVSMTSKSCRTFFSLVTMIPFQPLKARCTRAGHVSSTCGASSCTTDELPRESEDRERTDHAPRSCGECCTASQAVGAATCVHRRKITASSSPQRRSTRSAPTPTSRDRLLTPCAPSPGWPVSTKTPRSRSRVPSGPARRSLKELPPGVDNLSPRSRRAAVEMLRALVAAEQGTDDQSRTSTSFVGRKPTKQRLNTSRLTRTTTPSPSYSRRSTPHTKGHGLGPSSRSPRRCQRSRGREIPRRSTR
jgi:hypothetical protein